MTIKVKDFIRVTYVCSACELSAPPFEIEAVQFAVPPTGWRSLGLGKYPRHFCKSCCDRSLPSGGRTVREVIDDFMQLHDMDDSEVGILQIRPKVA